MRIQARFKKHESIGIVVKIEKANNLSLKASKHSESFMSNSSDIYYVFFPGEELDYPYYSGELTLESEAP